MASDVVGMTALAATGQATERDKKPVSSSSHHPRPAFTSRMFHVGRHEALARLGWGCIVSRKGRQWEREEESNMGVGGPRLGRSHSRLQYLDAGCQNPVTAVGCPLQERGPETSFTQQECVGKKCRERNLAQPLNPGSTGCIYIRPDRMFLLHGSPGGSLISAVDYKKSRGHASLLRSFCFYRLPSVRVSLASLFLICAHSHYQVDEGINSPANPHQCSDPEHPPQDHPSRIPTIRWMNRWSRLPRRNIYSHLIRNPPPQRITGSSRPH